MSGDVMEESEKAKWREEAFRRVRRPSDGGDGSRHVIFAERHTVPGRYGIGRRTVEFHAACAADLDRLAFKDDESFFAFVKYHESQFPDTTFTVAHAKWEVM